MESYITDEQIKLFEQLKGLVEENEIGVEYNSIGVEADNKILKLLEDGLSLGDTVIYLNGFYDIYDDYIGQYIRYRVNKKHTIQQMGRLNSSQLDNILVRMTGNQGYVSLRNAWDTVDTIEKIAATIDDENLSPMENIMYAYDVVKERKYEEADKGQRKCIARSVTPVLKSNKTVCVGFVQYFKSILACLGIKVYDIRIWYDKSDKGHLRAGIYVKDDKYGIDGFYYFDPTFDCKKADEDYEYIDNYAYFALTKDQMTRLCGTSGVEIGMEAYSKDFIDNFAELLKGTENPEEDRLIEDPITVNKYIDTASNMLKYTNTMCKVPQRNEKLAQYLTTAFEKMNKPLEAATLLQIFEVVREAEFRKNPKKYPYSDEVIENAYNKNWNTMKNLFPIERIEYSIFKQLPSEFEPTEVSEEEKENLRRVLKKI